MLEFLFVPGVAIGVAAIVGLLVGSFLNVVILRLPARLEFNWRSESRELLGVTAPTSEAETQPPGIVWESSHCPHCNHSLGALENIPVLSWLVLRGKCKRCGAPISAQYPLVELLSAIASALVVWKFGLSWQSAAGLIFTWTLIALGGIDVRTQLLPDQLTLPLLWLGLLVSTISLFVDSYASIFGAAAGYLALWLVFWAFKLATGKEGMGYGDFKLLGALGAWMGAVSLPPIILLSSLIGAIVGGAFLAVQGRDRATPIPFGPFLATAGWVQFIFGTQILALYRYLFNFA